MILKIAIAIATAGRRDVLSETIAFLGNQSRIADELLICPAKEEDLDPACLKNYPGIFSICRGSVGSSPQRNSLMKATDAEVIIFFDDDFLPSDDYVKEVELLFMRHSDVVVATGKVLADGIIGPGLTHSEATRILTNAGSNSDSSEVEAVYNGYGCNMAVRAQSVKKHGVRFDERLPLYAWLEDVDFSRQLAPYGKIVRAPRLRGVHLGTKSLGRSPGKRLGYSQVINPIYLAFKGTMNWKRALKQVGRNLLANTVRSLSPEPWVDRRGRLKGNLKALFHLALGKVQPENAAKT